MSMRMSGEEIQRLAYDAIVRAARAGLQCPTNPELCDIIGACSPSAGANVVAKLEKRGLITVERFNSGRNVSVPSLGLATRPYGGRSREHWRANGRQPARKAYTALKAEASTSQAAVAREPSPFPSAPCFRCGARGWCGHDGRIGA